MSLNAKFKAQIVKALRNFVVLLVGQPAIAALLHGHAGITRAAVVAAVYTAFDAAVFAVWPQSPLKAINGVVGSFAKKLVAKTPPPAA